MHNESVKKGVPFTVVNKPNIVGLLTPEKMGTCASHESPINEKRLVKPSSYLLSPYMNKKTKILPKISKPEFILGNIFETNSGISIYSVRVNMETLAPGVDVDANTTSMFDGKLPSFDDKFEEFEKELSAQLKDNVGGLALDGIDLQKLFASHLKLYAHRKHASIAKAKPKIANLKWRTKNNIRDCGIFTMLHMESYTGQAVGKWDSMELRSGLEIDANLVLSESYIKKLQIIAIMIVTVIYCLRALNLRILQDLNLEFDGLNTEYKDLEVVLAQTAMKGSERRIHMGRKREVKHGIKRLEKLMKTVASTQTALQLLFSEMPHVEAVILILGGSPGRPRHVYEVAFSHGPGVRSDPSDFTRTRVAEGISRKVLYRCSLFSMSSGHWYPKVLDLILMQVFFDQLESYVIKTMSLLEMGEFKSILKLCNFLGPSRLFLLVKAHSSFNMPQHFLPKRDFRYNKKIFTKRTHVGPLSKTVRFNVLKVIPAGSSGGGKKAFTGI
ncbi:hypothetical protein CTI12_AA249350 [Artemisia annua]|uniref:Uncharacterized protein n=1 Tax=Artemisia annua TaxID=35608 RepID=A0A2U1NMC9_ARTAN|nr:hypothetical protein CTI12_AA249350 [Artemisia annua]